MAPSTETPSRLQPALRPRSQRLERLVLACAGRLCRDAEGKTWLIKGHPAPVALFDGLHKLDLELPTIPHPYRFVFDASQFLRLSHAQFADWRRELARVRKTPAPSRSKPRRVWGVRHAAAVAALEARLAWMEAQLAPELPPGYPLSGEDEGTLTVRIAEDLPGLHLPPAWRWMARFLVWLDGPARLGPLLQSLRPHLVGEAEFTEIAGLVQFRTKVEGWAQESKYHPGEMSRQLPDLVLDALCSMLRALADTGTIEIPAPGRRARSICQRLHNRTAELLGRRAERLSSAPPALLVSLFASGLAHKNLRGFWLQRIMTRDPNTWHPPAREFVVALAKEARRKGYAQMLATLEAHPMTLDAEDLANVRQAHAAGATQDELKWLADRHMPWEFTRVTRSTRRLDQLLLARGLDIHGRMLQVFNRRDDNELALAAAQWVARLPKSLPTGPARTAIFQLFQTLTIFEPLFGQCREHFLQLLAEPQASEDDTSTLPDLGPWLARLVHQRGQAGGKRTVPARIRRALEADQRAEREQAWLAEAAAGGELSREQQARLTLLAARKDAPRSPRSCKAAARKLLSWTHEGYATTAAEAAARIVAAKVDLWWRAVMGPPRSQVDADERVSLCNWAQKLNPAQRTDLTRLLDAWNMHGADYVRNLPGNADWLDHARERGIDIDAWLAPEPVQVVIAGERLRIERTSDPVDILMMGTWFHTCLSLGDINEMSVLANAYEPDKAILYVRNMRGTPVARKLVALTRDDRLLGYEVYRRGPEWGDPAQSYEDKTAELERALDKFGVKWVQQAGLAGLANEGTPAIQGLRFWYDDTPCTWSEALPVAPPAPSMDQQPCMADALVAAV